MNKQRYLMDGIIGDKNGTLPWSGISVRIAGKNLFRPLSFARIVHRKR